MSAHDESNCPDTDCPKCWAIEADIERADEQYDLPDDHDHDGCSVCIADGIGSAEPW